MLDTENNNCIIRNRVKGHKQAWYKVYTYQDPLMRDRDESQALTAQFRHEGDAYRYANILQANPSYIRLIVIK